MIFRLSPISIKLTKLRKQHNLKVLFKRITLIIFVIHKITNDTFSYYLQANTIFQPGLTIIYESCGLCFTCAIILIWNAHILYARCPIRVFLITIVIGAIIVANILYVYIIILISNTTETQTIPFDVSTRCRPTWSHKCLCFFTLFVYIMCLLCDHTTYCNNCTRAYQLPINSVYYYIFCNCTSYKYHAPCLPFMNYGHIIIIFFYYSSDQGHSFQFLLSLLTGAVT